MDRTEAEEQQTKELRTWVISALTLGEAPKEGSQYFLCFGPGQRCSGAIAFTDVEGEMARAQRTTGWEVPGIAVGIDDVDTHSISGRHLTIPHSRRALGDPGTQLCWRVQAAGELDQGRDSARAP